MPYPAALGQRPLEVHEAYAALEQYAADYGRDPLLLLMHASVPETLRPDLLNLIRVNFLAAHGPDPSLEADVLFSPLATALGGGYYRIDAQVRWHCLVMLRSLYRHDLRPRIRRIAELLWRYVEAREHQASRAADPQLAEFLDIQRWVALAFLEPASAAHAFADALRQTHADGSTVALRLGGLASAIELPLAGQPELLAYARGLDALASGNDTEAQRLLGALGSDEIRVGDIVLKAPEAVLAAYHAQGSAPAKEGDAPRRRTCLVIQAFGIHTDHVSGQVLDMDASYEIIRDALGNAGIICVRCDDFAFLSDGGRALIQHILSADLLICDLSIGNDPTRYLTGVSLALRASNVILLAETHFPADALPPWLGTVMRYPAPSLSVASSSNQWAQLDSALTRFTLGLAPDEFPGPVLTALAAAPMNVEAPPTLMTGTAQPDPAPLFPPAADDLASTCYVIQGFGVKTDLVTGRNLDLDKSFAVIQHAVTATGLQCVRPDMVQASLPNQALDLLLRAPLAIVDLSLGLPDVLLQLGLRHGLRPGQTLLLAEEGYRIPPELSSLRIVRYTHEGNGLDNRASERLQAAIGDWIQAAQANPAIDSPVYAALPNLRPPVRRPPAPEPEALAEDPVPPQSRPRVFISFASNHTRYATLLENALNALEIDVEENEEPDGAQGTRLTFKKPLTRSTHLVFDTPTAKRKKRAAAYEPSANLEHVDAIVVLAGAELSKSALAVIENGESLGKPIIPVFIDSFNEPKHLLRYHSANTDYNGDLLYYDSLDGDALNRAIIQTAHRIAEALYRAPAELGEKPDSAPTPTATWELTIRQRGEGALQFILLIDGQRIEATVHFQRTLVDKLADELLAGIHLRTDAAQALRQLLLPRELIALGAPARYHLTLGPDTAALPWELIFHRPDDPFAHLGPRNVLRRLDGLREPGLRQSAGFQALLIGNPQTARSLPDHEEGLPLLGGVAQELDGVAHSLAAAGFEVGLSAEESASAVMSRLFALDYRVLLISGNSVHEHPIGGRRVSGFVLSDGVFLTALELRQMRVMPEVVFLNGCHAGRRVANASDGPPQDMVLELLKAGVKVVVAPGWAVGDMSAAQFSETFFTILATGRPFEEAVAGARVASYKAAPDLTTWAAYQAWGDPDYRLLPPPASEAA